MYIKVLKNRNFLKVYFATCISSFGDGLDDIAFALLLYSVSGSTLITSYVFAIKIIFSFLSIFTGALSDRLNRKNLIFLGEIGQALILLLLLLINKIYKINTSLLIIFSTIQVVFSTISIPSKNSLSLLVMDKKVLVESKSLLNISLQLIQIFSYALSSIFIKVLGTYKMLFIDSLTFIISGALFLTIRYVEVNVPYKKISEFKKDVIDGFVFIKNKTGIMLILILAFCGNVLMSPSEALLPAYFETYYNNGNEYALFMCTLSIGGILSALLLPKICKLISESNLLIIGFVCGGIGSLILLNINSNIFFYIAAILIGISFSLVSILNSNILQRFTPDNMLGRVFSVFKCISYLSSPIGIVLMGALGDFISIRYIFFICGISMVILTLVGHVFLKYNKLNESKLNEVL